MANYAYRALDQAGKLCEGAAEVASVGQLRAFLQAQQWVLLSARRQWWQRPLPLVVVAAWCEQLAAMIEAGIPILDSLDELLVHSPDARLLALTQGLKQQIAQGASLSQALAVHGAWFSPMSLALIRAGEVSGQLPLMLLEIAEAWRWQLDLKARFQRLLSYPLLLLTVIFAVFMFLLVYLVPKMLPLFALFGQDPPWMTRVLMVLSVVCVTSMAYLWLPVLLLLLGFVLWHTPRYLENALLRVPKIGDAWQAWQLARFCHALASLYRAGVPILDALGLAVETVASTTLGQALQRVVNAVHHGASFSQELGRLPQVPRLVRRLVHTGEQTGQLDHALRQARDALQQGIVQQTDRWQTWLAPVLTMVMGALIAFVLSAVLLPLYEMLGHFQG